MIPSQKGECVSCIPYTLWYKIYMTVTYRYILTQPAQAEREQGAAAVLRGAAKAARAAARTAQPEPWLDTWTNMGGALYGRTEEPPVAGDNILSREDPAAVAEGAAAKPMPQPTRDSIQSIRGTTRETTMDFWRYLLAVAQVAAAVQIDFDEVKSALMARFHKVREVFPDALYGQIIVSFNVAELRGQMKDLQKGILYRQERATPKHRDLYDVLEENLVVGNQEMESNMTFFATSERKERTFGEWIACVLGLWNVVEIHQVKKMVECTKKGHMIEVHHVDALREYAEALQDNFSKLSKRILEQATFLLGRMKEISSKAAVNDALKPIRAIRRIATTIPGEYLLLCPNVVEVRALHNWEEGQLIEIVSSTSPPQ
jgi:hypothetical protein